MPHTLITGANRGIGLELVHQYISKKWKVTAVCREVTAELNKLNPFQIIDDIDVTNSESIDRLISYLKGEKIDLLINNAGILNDDVLGEIDYDSLRVQMETNAFAPLKIVEALLPNLGNGSKVANITSRMGSIGDNDSGGRYGYRASKAAFNAIGRSLAIDLKSKGIAVAQLHPGFVKTRMVNFGGLITTKESVDGLIKRIEALNLENSGSFWHCNGETLPW